MRILAMSSVLFGLMVPALASTGCAPESDDEAHVGGTLSMPLTAISDSGASYRLRSAKFTISGAGTGSLSSEDFLDQQVAETDLSVGSYQIVLEPGWFLERTDGPTPGRVNATQESVNPQAFAIQDQAMTQVDFVFDTDGEVVKLGTGKLRVGVKVHDEHPPVCGNGIVEGSEACDDGNALAGDGCDPTCRLEPKAPTAFRFTSLALRDPHVFVSFIGCRDFTDTSLAGQSFNGLLNNSLTQDSNSDGLVDLSKLLVFRPFDASPMGSGAVDIIDGACTLPGASTTCHPGAQAPTATTYSNQSTGVCLDVIAGTAGNYSPAITTPAAGCFSTAPTQLNLTVGGIPLPLRDVSIAATDAPGMGALSNGLLRGFLTQADADATLIPNSVALVGGKPLSSLLGGGAGSCAPAADKDVAADGTPGWWFYFNYQASQVSYSEP